MRTEEANRLAARCMTWPTADPAPHERRARTADPGARPDEAPARPYGPRTDQPFILNL
ncbi:hypothetical protein ACL02O_22760 [Micromonospora sp. MS34]|uniref:hypothetical protein n=1 Tax=Micromonospora sp. MS34 TaxID=3385971 RepID=UPI0039A1B9F2